MALMPIAENQQNLRALHELEMIKKYMAEQMQEMEEEIERIQIDVFGQAIKTNKKHPTLWHKSDQKILNFSLLGLLIAVYK